ncbi:hypothetical protein BJF93_13955 [Xaviernesmea oryzae]|uniref:Uncharacterized protein n=1 Tax=Xaviernesmea oryzae TaxID=464029 RepID=A0A1Q9ARD8_9HYPH|nr:hypothetical protein [Xaviernesmea oryzae]OLP57936.1 hypothetical protein BJF93_13955 [Xaviernesmea oryzae]SEL30054.1 hypothetical protein SAMN04487976_10773 [Xaviernesmea oryzae]
MTHRLGSNSATGAPSRRKLLASIAFMGLMASIILVFLRPLGVAEWVSLVISIAFVLLGCVVLWRQREGKRATSRVAALSAGFAARPADEDAFPHLDAIVGSPSPQERQAIETVLSALMEAEALDPGEVDADLLWRAAQELDPGETIGIGEAINAFGTLHEAGRFEARRMTFVPVHVEYDSALLAAIALSILRSLGHRIGADDIRLTLAERGTEVEASMALTLEDRVETITFPFLFKDAAPELFPALARLGRAKEPRVLVCADPGYQALVFVAVRPGSEELLNRRLSANGNLFGPP